MSGTVLLSPGHAPGEEVEPDTPALRRLAKEKQPGGQLGAPWSSEVAAEAADEPVRRLPCLLGLLQKGVIFTSKGQQFRARSVDCRSEERRKAEGRLTGDELVVVELGERDGVSAGALAGAGGPALVGLDAGEAAGEASAAGAPVLPRLLPALLAWGSLLPAAAAAAGARAGVGGRLLRVRRLLPIVIHSGGGGRTGVRRGGEGLGFNGEVYQPPARPPRRVGRSSQTPTGN